jgi:DNA-binding CsgD family transcriptional regulator
MHCVSPVLTMRCNKLQRGRKMNTSVWVEPSARNAQQVGAVGVSGLAGQAFELGLDKRNVTMPQPCSVAPRSDGAALPLLQGLEGLSHGVALFDAGGDVHYANRQAWQVLRRLGWCTSAHTVYAIPPGQSSRWADALQRVCGRGLRELVDLGGPDHSVYVAMAPVATLQGRFAFVTFARDELCGGVELELFSMRYGLTCTESEVLRQLCRGLTAAQIAHTHGVAACTVLTQISAIRSKTRFKSVRKLLDALARMPPMSPAAGMRDWSPTAGLTAHATG